jgi:Uma2 family endonuclease
MASVLAGRPEITVGDLAERFGPIPLSRIVRNPLPGTATERDVLAIYERDKKLCELVDGILVEKPMGYEESVIAAEIIRRIGNFVRRRKLGIVAGEAGMLKLARGLIRIPDVSYVSYSRLPGRKRPRQPIPRLAPNLAIEVLSESNTAREMQEKLVEYFGAGVELVWFVDVQNQSIEVFKAPNSSVVFRSTQIVTGGAVLRGFRLKVGELFKEME